MRSPVSAHSSRTTDGMSNLSVFRNPSCSYLRACALITCFSLYGVSPVAKQNCPLVIQMPTNSGKKLRFIILGGFILLLFGRKITAFFLNMQIFRAFCHNFACPLHTLCRLLNLKKVKKPKKLKIICRRQIKAVPLQRIRDCSGHYPAIYGEISGHMRTVNH